MAINYTVQTITDPGAVVVNNMPNVQNAIRDAILLNSSWSLVQEMDSGNYHWVILKCSAGGSGLPEDFHLGIQRVLPTAGSNNTGINTIAFTLFEQYTPGTPGTIGRHVPIYTDTPSAIHTTLGYRTNTVLTTYTGGTALGNFANSGGYITATVTATIRVVVADSYVLIWSDKFPNPTQGPVYVGALDSVVPNAATNDPMPIAISWGANGSGAGGSSTNAMITRLPNPASATPGQYSFTLEDPGSGLTFPSLQDASLTDFDKYNGGPSASRIIARQSTSFRSTNGYVRAMWRGARRIVALPTGMAIGDTLTISGTKWVWLGGANTLFDTGAV